MAKELSAEELTKKELERQLSNVTYADHDMENGTGVVNRAYLDVNAVVAEATEKPREAVAKSVTTLAEEPFNQEENDVKQGQRKAEDAMAVLNMATAVFETSKINSVYDSVDFESKEAKNWFAKTGYASDAEFERIERSGLVNFNEVGVPSVEMKLEDGSRVAVTMNHFDQMAENGFATFAGHTEQVTEKITETFSCDRVMNIGDSVVDSVRATANIDAAISELQSKIETRNETIASCEKQIAQANLEMTQIYHPEQLPYQAASAVPNPVGNISGVGPTGGVSPVSNAASGSMVNASIAANSTPVANTGAMAGINPTGGISPVSGSSPFVNNANNNPIPGISPTGNVGPMSAAGATAAHIPQQAGSQPSSGNRLFPNTDNGAVKNIDVTGGLKNPAQAAATQAAQQPQPQHYQQTAEQRDKAKTIKAQEELEKKIDRFQNTANTARADLDRFNKDMEVLTKAKQEGTRIDFGYRVSNSKGEVLRNFDSNSFASGQAMFHQDAKTFAFTMRDFDPQKKGQMIEKTAVVRNDVLKQYDLSKAVVLDKRGFETGESAEHLLQYGTNWKDYQAKRTEAFHKQDAFHKSDEAHLTKGKSEMAKGRALQQINNTGYNYLSSQKELREVLSGQATGQARLAEIQKAKAEIQKKLSAAQKFGDANAVGRYNELLKDIKTYEKYGGKLADFKPSGNGQAKLRRGGRVLLQWSGAANSDAISGLLRTADTVHAVRSVAKNGAALVTKSFRNTGISATRGINKAVTFADEHAKNSVTRALKSHSDENLRRANYSQNLHKARMSGNKEEIRQLKLTETKRRNARTADIAQNKADKIAQQLSDPNRNFSDKKREKLKDRQEKLEKKSVRKEKKNEVLSAKDTRRENKRITKEQKIQAKKDRRKERFDHSRVGKKWNGAVGKVNRAKAAISSSFIGKAAKKAQVVTKAVAKALSDVFSILGKIKMVVIGACIAVVIRLLAVTQIGLIISNIYAHMFGNIVDAAEVIKNGPEGYINLNQYIVDKTAYSMGSTFFKVATSDAKWHFLVDDIFTKYPSCLDLGYNEEASFNGKNYYWAKSIDTVGVGHIWAREEADNTSHWNADEEEALIYGDTYKAPADRQELGSVNINIAPIMAMANWRVTGSIHPQNFRTTEAYAYYMFIMSHDKSRFADDDGDGVAEDPYDMLDGPTHSFDYHTVWVTGNVQPGRGWLNPDSSEYALQRNTIYDDCANVYFHGYNQANFGTIGAVRMFAAKTVNDLEADIKNFASKVSGGDGVGSYETSFLPLGTELCTGNSSDGYYFSGNWKQEGQGSGAMYSRNHINGSDGSTVADYSAFVTDGHVACDNMKVSRWSIIEDYSIGNQAASFHGYKPIVRTRNVNDDGGEFDVAELQAPEGNSTSGYTWYATTCGMKEHTHGSGCVYDTDYHNHEVKNDTRIVTKWVPSSDGTYLVPEDRPEDIHTCNEKCCGLCEHTHSPFADAGNPGCWTGVAICQGHCGGHLNARLNIVVVNDWEGLMALDNFKMTYFLTEADFTTLLHYDQYLPSLDMWQALWKGKAQQWFDIFPTTPLTDNPLIHIADGAISGSAVFGSGNKIMNSDAWKTYASQNAYIASMHDGKLNEGTKINLNMAMSELKYEMDHPTRVSTYTSGDRKDANSVLEEVTINAEDMGFEGGGKYTFTRTGADYQGLDEEGNPSENLFPAFTGWWEEPHTETSLVQGPDGLHQVTKTVGGYEPNVTMMEVMFGTGKDENGLYDQWSDIRVIYGGYEDECPKYSDGEYGIAFPVSNDVSNPGTWTYRKAAVVFNAFTGQEDKYRVD